MKNILLILVFITSIETLYAQFYVGRNYTVLESQINRMAPNKVNILKAPLEYDAVAGFTGHKIQFSKYSFVIKFIVEIDKNGLITECVNYMSYNTQNKELSDIVTAERKKTLYTYRSLNGKFKTDGEYTMFIGDSFIGLVCTDNNKPFMHYEALKSEYKKQ